MGDHKAIAFEQGAQCGGNFPCGTCGIHVSKFTDQTHALRRRVRLLQDIQNLQHRAVLVRDSMLYDPLKI